MNCYSCNSPLQIKEKPSRRDDCPQCGASVRVCLNCRFYDKSAYNDCREPAADRVVDKEKANFCDFFEPGGGGKGEGMDAKSDAQKKLDDLFG